MIWKGKRWRTVSALMGLVLRPPRWQRIIDGQASAQAVLAVPAVYSWRLRPLKNFRAKLRGSSPPTLDYTWNKIYNSKSMMSCSNMPRFGHQGILIEQQMRDVMTYLSDANSPAHR